MFHDYISSIFWKIRADLRALRETKNLQEDGDRRQEQKCDPGAGIHRCSRRQDESKSKQKHKNIDVELGMEWKERPGNWSENKTVCDMKVRTGDYVWGKQPSCRVGQCGGRLIRKCVPLPAGLDQRLAKRTSLKSHQPSESCLSFAPSLWGFGFPAWGGCGSGAGVVAVGWILYPCDLHVKASLNKLLNPKLWGMDACDWLFLLMKVCFVWSEMNKQELHTYLLEHVSASNFNFPVSGLRVLSLWKWTHAIISKLKRARFAIILHTYEKNTVWMWEERKPAQI